MFTASAFAFSVTINNPLKPSEKVLALALSKHGTIDNDLRSEWLRGMGNWMFAKKISEFKQCSLSCLEVKDMKLA